jgi:hypothetical protein
MSLILLFHKLVSRQFHISDESTNCDPLPLSEQSDAMVLKCTTEIALSLNMDGRVVAGADTIILKRQTLFTVMASENELQWLRTGGARPLHPHEVQTQKLKGLLPEVITNTLCIPWLTAERLRARCMGVGQGSLLTVERGRVELVEAFGALPTGQTMNEGFTG